MGVSVAYAQSEDSLKTVIQNAKAEQDWLSCVKHSNVLLEVMENNTAKNNDRYFKLAKENGLMASGKLKLDELEAGIAFQKYADALSATGKRNDAIFYLEKAKSIFTINGSWQEASYSTVGLAFNYYFKTQYDSTEIWIEDARAIAEEHLSPDNQVYTAIYSVRSALYRQTGDLNKALQTVLQEIDLRHRQNPVDQKKLAVCYNNAGQMYIVRGDTDNAIEYSTQALSLLDPTKQEQLLSIANCYNSIGLAYNRKEDYLQYLHYAIKNLEIIQQFPQKKYPREYIGAHMNVGMGYLKTEQTSKAIHHLKEAEKLAKTKTFYKKELLSNLGFLYLTTGDNEKAKTYFRQAIEETRKNHGDRHPLLAKLYTHLGNIAFSNQHHEKALSNYQRAIIILSDQFEDESKLKNPRVENFWTTENLLPVLRHKGAALEKIGQLNAALETYQLAVLVIDEIRQGYISSEAKQSLVVNAYPVFEKAIHISNQLYQNTKDDQYLYQAFQLAEKSKAVMLLEALKNSDANMFSGIPDSLRQQERELKINIAFYKDQLYQAQQDSSSMLETYQTYLFNENQAYQDLIDHLEKNYPEYYERKYQDAVINAKQIQKTILQERNAFIEYFSGDSSIYVICLSKQDGIKMHHFSKPADFENRIQNFRRSIQDLNFINDSTALAYQQYTQEAHYFFKTLLAPVLPEKAKQLIIIPDGLLAYIPFDVLLKNPAPKGIDFHNLDYLVYDYQISYNYSATMHYRNIRQKPTHKKQRYAAFAPFANITQSFDPAVSLLPGTQLEVEAIANHFKGNTFLGPEATKERLHGQAPEYAILHFATHGLVDMENPVYSNLVFYKDNDTANHRLHVFELQNMNIQANLVVLSACETGLGRYVRGEGIMSLSRGFMYAGIPSQVLTLWKIQDKSSADLMDAFYENLSDEQKVGTALQEAKIKFLREKADGLTAHPHFWAGFVLMGDDRALPKPSFPKHLKIMAIIAGVILLFISRLRFYAN